jgi:hypothetical protein
MVLKKRIDFEKAFDSIVLPELEKLGFKVNKRLSGSGIFELGRVRNRWNEIIFCQNSIESIPYIKPHKTFTIAFNIIDEDVKIQIEMDMLHRTFAPPMNLFPKNGTWTYTDQTNLKDVLKILVEELKNRGLKWFDLARAGERGEALMKVLGERLPPITQEEYERRSTPMDKKKLDEVKRVIWKLRVEPFIALKKRIRFRKALDSIVRPELEKIGFEINKGILFARGPGGVYEFSRIREQYYEIISYSNRIGSNIYIRTHVELLGEFGIAFYIIDRNTKEHIKVDYLYRVFSAPSNLFPKNGSWVYFNQTHLEEVLRISIEELRVRGLKWFDLVKAGEKGEALMNVLGERMPPMSQEEYDRSEWKQRFSPN